jgi:hypothetical protein
MESALFTERPERKTAMIGQGEEPVGELGLLREENKQLRELVIQLSKLVVRNVLEHR